MKANDFIQKDCQKPSQKQLLTKLIYLKLTNKLEYKYGNFMHGC